MEITNNDINIYKRFQKSPLFFIEKIWKLVPQPIKEEYKNEVQQYVTDKNFEKIHRFHFETFKKNNHITWQQWIFFLQIENALAGIGKKRISVSSGHGTGKTSALAMLILWFLFCFKDAQIPCTAPTSEQMHDILWKEISIWLDKMPKKIKELYEWQTGYLRIKERPDTWFARAKTARKEAPEALAGVHGRFVMFVIDEASGVPNEIFNIAEGALTGENVLVIMISNMTRREGYFFDSHHSDKGAWQTLVFDSEESPIVEQRFVERIIAKHGKDSDEFRIRVKGLPPKEGVIDDSGYVQLFSEKDLRFGESREFVGPIRIGIDPAGEGKNKTKWVARDSFHARVIAEEKQSTGKSIAQKTLTILESLEIEKDGNNIYVDAFGEGVYAIQELAGAGIAVRAINTGDKPNDSERFLNIRSETAFLLKQWIRSEGEIVPTEDTKRQMLSIKFRRELSGKIKLKSKREMIKDGEESPDEFDALCLTFVDGIDMVSEKSNDYQPPHETATEYEGAFENVHKRFISEEELAKM